MPPVMTMPTAAMMAMMIADVLGVRIRNVILIGDRGLCGQIRLRLGTVHQILLRGQHRRCTRRCRSGCNRTCAGSNAKRELEKITTFHQLFSF